MAFGITPTGFNLKTFGDIRQEVEDYQAAHISEGLEFSDDADLSQVNISHFLELAALWELAQTVYAAYDPDTSNDWSLDQVSSITGTTRTKLSKTTVTGQVTLNPNKALPAGSFANLTGQPNTRFITLVEVPADPGGGTFDASFEAVDAGAVDVAVGQLSEISVAVSGWTAVTNALAGDPGGEPEADTDFRDKRDRELESSGSTNLDAIVAGVSDTPTVVDVKGVDNDSWGFVNGLPPKSVAITVRGGSDQDVAEAIFLEKSAGITAFGSTNISVEDSQGEENNIGFTRALAKPVFVEIDVEIDDDWDGSTSENELKAVIAGIASATSAAGYLNKLGISEDVIYDNIKAVSFITGVVDIVSLKIGFTVLPTGTVNLTIGDAEYATGDIANVDVSTTP